MRHRRGKLKRSEFFIKYLISYILVLVMPLSVLFSFSYSHADRLTQENMLGMQRGFVDQVKGSIEPAMQNAADIAQNIRQDNNMKYFILEDSQYNYYLTIRHLKEYLLANRLISSIVIYRGEEFPVINENGTFSPRYLGERIVCFEGMDAPELKAELSDLQDVRCFRSMVELPENPKQEYLVWWYSMQVHSVVMIFIDLTEIGNMIRTNSVFSDDCFMIMDRDGNMIWEEGERICEPEWLMGRIGKDTEGSEVFSTKEGDCSFSYAVGAQDGWIYCHVIGQSDISGELTELKRIYLGILLGLLLCGSMIIYLFLYTNYVPLKRLEKHVRQSIQDEFEDGEFNEIETISQAVRLLSDGLETVNAQMKALGPLRTDQAVACLLKGLAYDRTHLPEPFAQEAEGRCYLVACTGLQSEEREESRSEEWELFGEGAYGYRLGRPFVERDTYLFCFEPDAILKITQMLSRSAEVIGQRRKRKVCFYVSDPKSSIEQIPDAAYEAELAWELSEGGICERIVLYGDVIAGKRPRPDALDDICARTENAIALGDMETMLRLPAELENGAYQSLPRHRFKETLIRLMESASIYVSKDQAKALSHDMGILMHRYADTIDAGRFRNIFTALCQDLVNLSLSRKEEESQLKMEALADYIDKNFMDEDFSVSRMAENFSVSPSWLSHYFKKHMHVTLIEYVNEKKMNVAKELLSQSDTGLDVMAERLGYGSVSSFIRSFKKVVGMPPGKYRENFRKEEEKK